MDERLLRCLAVTMLMVCVPVALRGQEVAMASVPLLACSGLPCVEAVIAGGKHVRLLIDTGGSSADS